MSHVTEGELHAYIDGALRSFDSSAAERVTGHLETCGDCQVRAEAARALRDRASVLLDAALGDVAEVPPFEDLVERAGVDSGAGVSGSARPPWRFQRFAWAASLFVALGAGWMANAVSRDSGGAPLQAIPERMAETPVGSDLGADVSSDVDADPQGEVAADGRMREEVVAVQPALRDEESTNAQQLEPREARSFDAARAEPKPAASEIEAVAQPRRAEAAAPLAVAPATPERQDRGRGFAEVERAPEGATRGVESAANEQEEVGLAGAELDDLLWRPVEVVEAAEWVGGILTLPDVEVEEYALAAHEGRRLARVRQRLPGGETLELVQLGADSALDEFREGVLPSLEGDVLGRALAETGARAGMFSLGWIEVNGVHLRASAPVAPDSLRALISRIRRP